MESNQLFFNSYVEWTKRNWLKINVSKTKRMILCTENTNNCVNMNIHIKMNSVDISNTVLFRYLGCNLDRNLNMEPFVKDIIQRVNFKLYLFSKICNQLTFDAAVLVYKQMVLLCKEIC